MKISRILVIVLTVVSAALAFVGCTTGSDIMAASGGAYTVTKSGTTGFTSLGVLRKEAYQEANKFAASKGMIAEVLSVNEIPTAFGRWPQVDLRFRLVSAADRESGRRAPALTVVGQAGYDAVGNPTSAEIAVTKELDIYAELKKLGELKEKGFITEEEFQREKKRLLDARGK